MDALSHIVTNSSSAAYSLTSNNYTPANYPLLSDTTKIDLEAVMEAVGIVPQNPNTGDLPVLQDLNFSEFSGSMLSNPDQQQQQAFPSSQCVSSAREVLRNLVPCSQSLKSNYTSMALPSPPYSDPSSPDDSSASSQQSTGSVSHADYTLAAHTVSTIDPVKPQEVSSAGTTKVKAPRGRRPRTRPPADKPPTPYMEMIARALVAAPGHSLILGDIYAYILQNYPYYRTAPTTWKNAVRHNLTVNDCFIKAGASKGGRGFFWAIHPACVDMFRRGDFRRMQARRAAQVQARPTAVARTTSPPTPNPAAVSPPSSAASSSSPPYMASSMTSTSSPPGGAMTSPPHVAMDTTSRTPTPPSGAPQHLPTYHHHHHQHVPVPMTQQQLTMEMYQQYYANLHYDPYYHQHHYQHHQAYNQHQMQAYNTLDTFNYEANVTTLPYNHPQHQHHHHHQMTPSSGDASNYSYDQHLSANTTTIPEANIKVEQDQSGSEAGSPVASAAAPPEINLQALSSEKVMKVEREYNSTMGGLLTEIMASQ